MAKLIVRPGRLADLDQIEHMAANTYPMLHSLPADRAKLHDKLVSSDHCFAADISYPGEEAYFFVLEDPETGKLHGTATIVASAGFAGPFYAYRNEVIVNASHELKINNRVHALTLSHELTGYTQLSGFCVNPELANTHFPQLLSCARLLFLAEHPERFAEDLVSVLPGISDEAGASPFWDNVGRKFFGLEFRQAEFLSGGRDKTFIAELMPHHPIYVPLLSEDAQQVMGQVHPRSTLPFSILADEGFEADRHVDIFDAGPVMTAKRGLCRTFANSVRRPAFVGHQNASVWLWHLVCNDAVGDFRASLVRLPAELPDRVALDARTADLLKVESGDDVRVIRLHNLG
jgi:arginine N-succinyltransferase